jgi:hypothetical protein
VLKTIVSKDSLFPHPLSRNGEISLFSLEVFVNKWKVSQVLKILVSKDSLFLPPSRNGEISLFSFEVFVNKLKAPQVLKILVSKDSLFFPPQEMGKFRYFPLRYLSTSGRYCKCWKSWCLKDNLFWAPPLKKWRNFLIFLRGICQQVEGAASVENLGVHWKSLLPPQRNGEIFLFSRLLEKPQASLKVE